MYVLLSEGTYQELNWLFYECSPQTPTEKMSQGLVCPVYPGISCGNPGVGTIFILEEILWTWKAGTAKAGRKENGVVVTMASLNPFPLT